MFGFVENTTEYSAAPNPNVDVFGHEYRNTAKNAAGAYLAIAFDNRIAQIQLCSTENNVNIGRMKDLTGIV